MVVELLVDEDRELQSSLTPPIVRYSVSAMVCYRISSVSRWSDALLSVTVLTMQCVCVCH